MGEPKEFMKGSALGILARVAGWLLVLGLCATVLYPVFATAPTTGHPVRCISKLKQLATAVVIYQSDADDRLPPYFTFDGDIATKGFIASTLPYIKDKSRYLCPQDKGDTAKYQEGLPGKMSFVHCHSTKGIIPDFNKGNRTVKVDGDLLNLATTAYIRDPIRRSKKEGNSEISSPHIDGFNISYLDTHVKLVKVLNINTDF